ncbi:MAG: carboxylesterase/lipase family protein [Pseudomonadota bacterium]
MKTQTMLIAALTLGALPATAQTVTTRHGPVSGTSSDGVNRFLGIPYGADTGGENRFRKAKPAADWATTLPATEFGKRCPQPVIDKPNSLIRFANLPVSEDCLNLNVWAPAKAKKRPVMVWLHGGGYGFGSSADPYYDGTNLAKKEGVVLVSINHRLNGFGYLNLGPEAAGQFDANIGVQDIVLALQWVRANIAKFGGDPKNVTVFGQSGGGGKISVLMAMPAAKGLFAKAIIESGSDPRIRTPQEAIEVRDKVLAAAGLKPGEALKLRDLPMEKLVEIFSKVGVLSYWPYVDGAIVPTQPYDRVANPVSGDVALLVGTTRDEGNSVLATDPSFKQIDDAKAGMMAMMLTGPEYAAEAMALYKKHMPGEPARQIISRIMTDKMFSQTSAVLADAKSAQKAPVYKYRVDWRSPVLEGELRAGHGIEIPFVFDSLRPNDRLVGNGESQARMTELMRTSFANFARTGNPNVKGFPAWPRYDITQRATFIFNDPPSVIANPEPELRAFWDKTGAQKK